MMTKLIMLVALVFAGLNIPTTSWKTDAKNAKISFTVKGPFGTVNGNFSGFKSNIQFDENDLPASSIFASIEANTVRTGIRLRNKHLSKKEEWFNSGTYPLITFQSKKIEKTGAGYKASGDLKIKDIIKSTEIPFTFTSDKETGFFKGQFSIKREDFKLGKPGGSVGDTIRITLEVPATKM